MQTQRCGRCSACETVEMTKGAVLAECRPAGPGVDDRTVEMWNKVLADNPCNGDPATGDRVRAARARLAERRRVESLKEARAAAGLDHPSYFRGG